MYLDDKLFHLILERYRFMSVDAIRCESPWLIPPIRSLLQHDASGGHAVIRHVGMTAMELESRVSSNPNLPAASSFWNYESATASVCYLTVSGIEAIIDWMVGMEHRITLEMNVPVETSIGFSVMANTLDVLPCKRVRMVLERDYGTDFHIVTAFPIA